MKVLALSTEKYKRYINILLLFIIIIILKQCVTLQPFRITMVFPTF